MFSDPRISLLNEVLGPGSPVGAAEDTYLFYQVLRAGFTIIYEPASFIWHKHRRSMEALRHQLYGYGRGMIAYELETLVNEHDLRALLQLALVLPIWRLREIFREIKQLVSGKKSDTLELLSLGLRGNLAGPWAWWRSRRRVRTIGRRQKLVSHPMQPLEAVSGQLDLTAD
jgi:hypothetical protein